MAHCSTGYLQQTHQGLKSCNLPGNSHDTKCMCTTQSLSDPEATGAPKKAGQMELGFHRQLMDP